MTELLALSRDADAASQRSRRALRGLLADLHAAVGVLFDERRGATRHRRSAVQRRLLQGLELMFKLEEDVLFPALVDAEPDWDHLLSLSRHEVELLRDLAQLAGRTTAANRDVAMSVLHGLAGVHFARVDDLLLRDAAQDVAWAELEAQMRRLLGRWRGEIREQGEIEDEDIDPVGLPPR